MQDKVKAIEAKLAKVDDTEVIMEFVNQLNASTKKELSEATNKQGEEIHSKIDTMFNDHLKQDGVFGPDHEKYKTFKDYMFSELEAASTRFASKIEEDKNI